MYANDNADVTAGNTPDTANVSSSGFYEFNPAKAGQYVGVKKYNNWSNNGSLWVFINEIKIYQAPNILIFGNNVSITSDTTPADDLAMTP